MQIFKSIAKHSILFNNFFYFYISFLSEYVGKLITRERSIYLISMQRLHRMQPREMAAKYCTTGIVKRYGRFSEEARVSGHESYNARNYRIFRLHLRADLWSGLTLTTKAITLGEMTQNGDHYAVHDHSRSPISVSIEIPYVTNH